METTTIETTEAAIDHRAAYLANREAWRELARNKSNSAQSFIRYIITQANLLSEKIGPDVAQTWALRKLREGFTPSAQWGRRELQKWLAFEQRVGRPFDMTGPVVHINGKASDTVEAYRALTTFLHDEIRMEG